MEEKKRIIPHAAARSCMQLCQERRTGDLGSFDRHASPCLGIGIQSDKRAPVNTVFAFWLAHWEGSTDQRAVSTVQISVRRL
jgi:hypothetical protein